MSAKTWDDDWLPRQDDPNVTHAKLSTLSQSQVAADRDKNQ